MILSSLFATKISTNFKCCIFANLAFWTASGVCVWVDFLSQSNDKLRLRKLQPTVSCSQREYLDILAVSFVNMVIIAPFICCPLFEYVWNSMHPTTRLQETDDWNFGRELMMGLPIYFVVLEATFYAAHWVLHRPFFYKHVHKIHHRFKAPTAMAATYAHPLEFMFGNVLPIALGPILTNAHPYTAYAWYTMALLSTCKSHSGYDILGARFHDDHHLYTTCNFGTLRWGDCLFGTGRLLKKA